jgi:2-polyprenyl-6-methoxyphenol hydroxylase-like FAD-dependent oxidoreductase
VTAEVLIAGAGPTGLTLALELARREVAVRIVDEADRFSIGSRGDGLQPRTLEVFEDLGFLDDILASGIAAPLMRVYGSDGQVIWAGRMAEPTPPRPDVPYPNLWFVPQWRTEEILRAQLAMHGVHVELGAGVVDFAQDADGVTVCLDGGENVRTAFLVGADGGRSTVRKCLGVPFVGTTDDETRMWLADVRADGLDHDIGHGWMLADGTFFGFTPLAGSADTFVLGAMSPLDVESTLAGIQDAVDAVSGDMKVVLREVIWTTVWRSNVRMAQRFGVGRVLLAGDAAHVHPPTGGQGLNTGVQDAYNLGWKLAAVLEGVPEQLLNSYEAERLPVAAQVLGISSELLDKHLAGSADAMHRGESTQQLGINYRGGPLALDDGPGGALAAGDRAPDAPYVRDGLASRLFELYAGVHWTLLRFGEQAPRLDRAGVRSHVVGTEIVDADDHIGRAYDVPSGAAVLVRPDGYIGAITSDPAALVAYADALLAQAISAC